MADSRHNLLPEGAWPLLLRPRQAHAYLGMNRNLFNKLVRPQITELRPTPQVILYPRIALEEWASQYIECNGRPGHDGE